MRLAVTQRVEVVKGYDERRDCLDQRWTVLLAELGFEVVPVPNGLANPATWVSSIGVQGLVLTGGNDLEHLARASNIAPERDRTERELLAWAQTVGAPVLGVCRGMQMINCWLGGSLSAVHGHVACRHVIRSKVNKVAIEWQDREVNSFHGWGIFANQLAPGLEAMVWSDENLIEGVRHRTLPWLGIMWHPERESSPSVEDAELIRSAFLNVQGRKTSKGSE